MNAEIEGIVDNPEVLKRHQELQDEKVKAENELMQLQDKIDKHQSTYIERVESWKKNVAEVVKPLNKNFKEYMAALQYRGEVAMVETDTIDQYEVSKQATLV